LDEAALYIRGIIDAASQDDRAYQRYYWEEAQTS
jgi:hypothetical protein